ncbi:hypothetical protein L2724_06925 [Limosilactobacillus vaginalis]|jgi:hypothetical protein|uniref:Uncharacterized protein n=1 Tax=Limosilactobacillus vaginalis TaxID=1633 RepID=A0AAW5WUN8_9LACO|nr:hypothetical protein [Limosilactobacillus vaginalis]MCZ3668012.1 hypothetical protein [Limosilactobacillus vaginalis]
MRLIVNEPMFDSKTGKRGVGYSPDGGLSFIVQEDSNGRVFHQGNDDIKISQLIFDSLKMKSPNGTVFTLSVDDEGKLTTVKENNSDGDQEQTTHS